MALGVCYAKSGTDLGYGATRRPMPPRRVPAGSVLCEDLAYAATQSLCHVQYCRSLCYYAQY
eukprot:3270911-Rhodomonas_salina.3